MFQWLLLKRRLKSRPNSPPTTSGTGVQLAPQTSLLSLSQSRSIPFSRSFFIPSFLPLSLQLPPFPLCVSHLCQSSWGLHSFLTAGGALQCKHITLPHPASHSSGSTLPAHYSLSSCISHAPHFLHPPSTIVRSPFLCPCTSFCYFYNFFTADFLA